MKRRYRRYFIIFELGDKNLGTFVGEEAKGYAKIETKDDQGLLSIHCQNLEGNSSGNRYRWYLINTKTEEAPIVVEIGPMEVDEKGKGEMVCEFNTDNVKGSTENINNFDVLALVMQNRDKEKNKLYTPLVGYLDKEKPDAGSWRYALGKYLYIPLDEYEMPERETTRLYQPIVETEKKADETADDFVKEIIEEPAEKITDEVMEKTVGKYAEAAKDEIAGESPEESTEGIVNKITEKATEKSTEKIAKYNAEKITEKNVKEIGKESAKENTVEIVDEIARENINEAMGKSTGKIMDGVTKGLFTKSETKQKDDDSGETKKEEKNKKDKKDKMDEKNEYEVQMQAYVENSLKDFLKIKPFVDNLENYTWWQIPYNTKTMHRPYMPFILYLDSLGESKDHNISRMLQVIYIHQHHIFGICYDKDNRAKYYAYGISGRNLSSEQPFGLNDDYTYWHPCNNVPINIESYGYWILTIDPKTGEIIKNKDII